MINFTADITALKDQTTFGSTTTKYLKEWLGEAKITNIQMGKSTNGKDFVGLTVTTDDGDCVSKLWASTDKVLPTTIAKTLHILANAIPTDELKKFVDSTCQKVNSELELLQKVVGYYGADLSNSPVKCYLDRSKPGDYWENKVLFFNTEKEFEEYISKKANKKETTEIVNSDEEIVDEATKIALANL